MSTSSALIAEIEALRLALPEYTDPVQLQGAGDRIIAALALLPPADRDAAAGAMRGLITDLESYIFTLERHVKEQQG